MSKKTIKKTVTNRDLRSLLDECMTKCTKMEELLAGLDSILEEQEKRIIALEESSVGLAVDAAVTKTTAEEANTDNKEIEPSKDSQDSPGSTKEPSEESPYDLSVDHTPKE